MPHEVDPDVLSDAIEALTRGGPPDREPPPAPRPLPVQSFVVRARDVEPGVLARTNREAMRAMQSFAPDCVELARSMRLPGWEVLPTDPQRVDEILSGLERHDEATEAHWPEAKLADEVYRLVTERLARTSIQDLRVECTSGTTIQDVVAMTRALSRDAAERALPVQLSLYLGSFTPSDAQRTIERLVAFMGTWNRKEPPPSLHLSVDDASDRVIGALSPLLDQFEHRAGWSLGTVAIEWLIDRPGPLLSNPRYPLSSAVSRGRLRSVRVEQERLADVHGTAVAGLVLATAAAQLAETPLLLAAGRSPAAGVLDRQARTASDRAEQFAEVHEGWRQTVEQTLSLAERGVSWGSDDDPRQLPARWAAVMTQARLTWAGTVERMAEILMRCLGVPSAVLLWQGQGLLTELLRFHDLGAVSSRELGMAGVDGQDIASRSFALMVQRRRPA